MMMTPGEGDNRLMGGREVGNAAVYIYACMGWSTFASSSWRQGKGRAAKCGVFKFCEGVFGYIIIALICSFDISLCGGGYSFRGLM